MRTKKQQEWQSKMYVTTIAFTPEEFALVKSAIARVEGRGIAGWVNERGLNKGKTTVTRFIRTAVLATAECLANE